MGASATQDVRAYVFPYTAENMRIRLIDTPGMGDVRGIDQDNINVDNILSFVGRLKQLHAICFLLKPNNARSTVMFEFCMKQLMSRLHKSACANIMFIFTHSGGPGGKPEESLATLRKIIKGKYYISKYWNNSDAVIWEIQLLLFIFKHFFWKTFIISNLENYI